MKEGRDERKVPDVSLAGIVVKPATRATIEVGGGTALAVIAVVMMRVSSYSALRTVVFVAAILVATVLIVRSIGRTRDDDEQR